MGRFDIDRILDDLGITKGENSSASNEPLEIDAESGNGSGSSHTQDADEDQEQPVPIPSAGNAERAVEQIHDDIEQLVSEMSSGSPTRPGCTADRKNVESENVTGFISSGGLETYSASNHAELQSPGDAQVQASDSDEHVGHEVRHNVGPEDRPESDSADGENGRLLDDDSLNCIWLPDASQHEGADAAAFRDLGEMLLERGIVGADRLDVARSLIKQTPGKTLTAVLFEMGIDEEPIQQIVAELNGIPFERIDANDGFHYKMLTTLGVEFCRSNQVLPLRKEDRSIILGMVTSDDVFLMDEIRRRLGGAPIRPVLVTPSDIALVCEIQSEEEVIDPGLDDLLAEVAEDDIEVVDEGDDDVDFEKQAGESPVIRYVNFIIQSALKDGASDIHIEPGENKLKIRFRIDGILFERMNPMARMHAAIISRLKIMANLDISERRIPQDGRIRAVVGGRKLDLRVSTLPTVAGEKCVIRILDSRSISVGLDQLGFSENTLTIWRRQIKQPHGIILVTGPTGSGKTTTLYSSLREMDTAKLNISTVEDPVEYHLNNITQVQIHDKIGFTFASALRSLLRQDPDVVMVGEIRDTETAKIAVQAALTGHLVLSTLHTNDAPSSVTRLINIGVEPFLIGSALNSVLAQRLVRRVCEHCRKPQELDEELREFVAVHTMDLSKVSIGEGCERCRQTGYAGRLGIYEMLVLDDVTRDYIARNPNVTEFRRTCIERGMVSLRQDGLVKVGQGATTIEEVFRVTEATI